MLLAGPAPAAAQQVAPLTTSDGRIACQQGMTGIGRPPAWKAVAEKEALGGWALAETAGDATYQRFPLCISIQTAALDIDATLRFKIVSGTREQAAGLVLRAQDANDYYAVMVSARDKSVRLYRMRGGKRAQLGSATADIAIGRWHALRVVARWDRFEVWLDGSAQFGLSDRSLVHAGTVGVLSQADSVVHFGSLTVAPPP